MCLGVILHKQYCYRTQLKVFSFFLSNLHTAGRWRGVLYVHVYTTFKLLPVVVDFAKISVISAWFSCLAEGGSSLTVDVLCSVVYWQKGTGRVCVCLCVNSLVLGFKSALSYGLVFGTNVGGRQENIPWVRVKEMNKILTILHYFIWYLFYSQNCFYRSVHE